MEDPDADSPSPEHILPHTSPLLEVKEEPEDVDAARCDPLPEEAAGGPEEDPLWTPPSDCVRLKKACKTHQPARRRQRKKAATHSLQTLLEDSGPASPAAAPVKSEPDAEDENSAPVTAPIRAVDSGAMAAELDVPVKQRRKTRQPRRLWQKKTATDSLESLPEDGRPATPLAILPDAVKLELSPPAIQAADSDAIDAKLDSGPVAEPAVEFVEGQAAKEARKRKIEAKGEGPDPAAVATTNSLLEPRCRVCRQSCPNIRELLAHMRQHHRESAPLVCTACSKTFRCVQHLEKHMQTHFGARPLPCPEPGCGRCFTRLEGLQTHMGIHSGLRPHLCHTCGKAFLNLGTLHAHVRIHTGEKPHLCHTCGKGFINSSTLQVHMRVHTGVRPYRCDTCGYQFKAKSKLRTHTRTHTGERPHQCSSCPRSFSTRGALQSHTRKHTGEKPYKCETCGRAFSQTGTLQTHVRTHTGERPYPCPQCPRRFTTRSALRVHERQHTGERPYPCGHCERAFFTSYSLKIHENAYKREDALAKLRQQAAAAAESEEDADEPSDD